MGVGSFPAVLKSPGLHSAVTARRCATRTAVAVAVAGLLFPASLLVPLVATGAAGASTGGWGNMTIINNGQGSALVPVIGADDSGNAVSVWLQLDAALLTQVWAATYSPSAGWASANFIGPNNTGNSFGPRIAVAANGNA